VIVSDGSSDLRLNPSLIRNLCHMSTKVAFFIGLRAYKRSRDLVVAEKCYIFVVVLL